MNSPEYKFNHASTEDILLHLSKCNLLFDPPLNSYINVKDYSEKIRAKAITFEAWDNRELVALIACYLNNRENLQGYITNVSVLKTYQGKGIAKKILEQTIKRTLEFGFKNLSLEVEVNNKKAINLYQSSGFVLSGRVGNKYTMLNRLDENRNVLVSICCVTYNHEKYIRDAIEGFIMQKTTFLFEILIHDDASRDGTADIIREYEKKYPNIIKPIYQSENQYQQGRPISTVYQWNRARGKYIAMCEGDDYWTDPYKLQKQVDFLEANEDCNFSMGRVLVLNELTGKVTHRPDPKIHRENDVFSLMDYIKSPFSQTSSFLFRNDEGKFPDWFGSIHCGDYAIVLIKTGNGHIKYHRDVFSVYRIHGKGISHTVTYNVYERSIKATYLFENYLGEGYKYVFKWVRLRTRIEDMLRSTNKLKRIILRIFLLILNRIIR